MSVVYVSLSLSWWGATPQLKSRCTMPQTVVQCLFYSLPVCGKSELTLLPKGFHQLSLLGNETFIGIIFAMAKTSLGWEWVDFCLCEISCFAHLSIYESGLKWPPEGPPGSIGKHIHPVALCSWDSYRSNPSWVCVQLVTETSNAPGTGWKIQPQTRCYSISFKSSAKKNNTDRGCPEGCVAIHFFRYSKSFLGLTRPSMNHTRASLELCSLIRWYNWPILRDVTWNCPI